MTADLQPATDAPRRVETADQFVAWFADVVGHLNPKRWGRHNEIDRVGFELPRMPKMNLHTLTALLALPEANEMIRAKCNHCETTFECRRIVAPFVACDACIEKHQTDAAMERHRKWWEHVCPERFRKTDVAMSSFPKAIWQEAKAAYDANPKQSFFLYGPTGTCKTRVGMLLLKRALVRHDSKVGVLWPEKLSTLKSTFETTVFDRYAEYDYLLLDDTLLTACREPKLVETVKQLIDVRMRHERPFIVTSQIGQEEELKEGKEFGEAKAADIERIKALMRRLREECKVIGFAEAKPKEGESAF